MTTIDRSADQQSRSAPMASERRVAQLLGMARCAPLFLERQARAYGPVVRLRLGRGPVFLVTDPAATRSILVDEHAYPKGPGAGMGGGAVGESPLKAVLGNGLLTSKGEHHRRQRRLIQPAFHHERISGYADVMAAESTAMLASWTPGTVVDVHAAFAETTLRILTRTIFSSILSDEETATVRTAMRSTMRGPGANVILVAVSRRLGKRALAARREALAGIDALITRLIESRRDGEPGNDVLSWLLEARDSDGSAMSDQDVRDELLTLLLAGHETSTNALSWAYYLLAGHPDVAESLYAELDRVLDGRTPTVADLAHLHVTKAIADEAMRLYPPAWILLRHTETAGTLAGFDVPAHATILMSPYVTHRDPDIWADAATFRPSRWLTPDGTHDPAPPVRHAYFPFGGGPRMCIGNTFAAMEIALVIATTSASWRLARPDGREVRMSPRVTLRPRGGMPMTVLARRSQVRHG
jgi:cytochrome P450